MRDDDGMFERIWLIYDDEADERITWADNPNPYAEYDEQPDRAVEYVHASLIEQQAAEIAELRDALQSIREHVAIQPSPLAKAIVATCDAALAPKEG